MVKNKSYLTCIILAILVAAGTGCNKEKTEENSLAVPETGTREVRAEEISEKEKSPKVTFIEIGSVRCIPCKMMQPVMEKVESNYGDRVKVVFYDVWTAEGRPYGQQYGIRAIPTQVFLDASGKEYFRHEGFFPYEELRQVLKKGGVE